MQSKLWYTTAPSEWIEGLPIGNGRLAAMIHGNEKDIISLNHEWLWRGVNKNRDNKAVPQTKLLEIRELLKNDDFLNATLQTNATFAGNGGVSGKPKRVDAYQPAGNIEFLLHKENNYISRSLDIDVGIINIQRKQENDKINFTCFADINSNNIICKWYSENNFSGTLKYTRAEDINSKYACTYKDSKIVYQCSFDKGISFKTEAIINTNGSLKYFDNHIEVINARELILYINISTNLISLDNDFEKFPAPTNIKFDDILKSHSKKFAGIMNKFSIDIDVAKNNKPTDERIVNLKNGNQDDDLVLLYINYGKYLLVSSSINGELPANLQGKWNESINPPWESDYHFDINLQMNYWMAEIVNMPQCVESLITYVDSFIPHAKKAAMDLYSCRGVLFPIQSDAWGKSTPESYGWAAWISSAAWISRHYWDHYRYNGNIDFLKNHAYPFFKEIALFYEDYLILDENGIYQIMPSQSPENKFKGTGDLPVSIGISSAVDVQLAYDAISYAIYSAKILNIDIENIEKWEQLKNNLPNFKIGTDHRLLEWDIEREELEPGHRHLSHLYGLFPSDLFNPIERPKQYKAAQNSLEFRLKSGGGYTGWSRAWISCLYARLGDGNKLYENITELIKEFATVSLLDLHPPRIFQIDGNLGAVTAIIEGLAQFWDNKLHLLRALPPTWENGSIKGLKVPGGHTIDFVWENKKITKIDVTLGFSGNLIISANEDIIIKGSLGETTTILLK